jgi:Fe-only nitrogenase accessory protein AnfO
MTAYCLFSRPPGRAWEKQRQVPGNFLDGCAGLAAAREAMRAFIAALGDCRAIVGRNISGVAYNLLDQSGFRIYEADSLSPGLLDEIAAEQVRSAENQPVDAPTVPQEGPEPGLYAFNLAAAMAAHPGLTSKKALLPFFERTPFFKLQLYCRHRPPWFDLYFPAHGLAYTQTAREDGVLVTITRALCL